MGPNEVLLILIASCVLAIVIYLVSLHLSGKLDLVKNHINGGANQQVGKPVGVVGVGSFRPVEPDGRLEQQKPVVVQVEARQVHAANIPKYVQRSTPQSADSTRIQRQTPPVTVIRPTVQSFAHRPSPRTTLHQSQPSSSPVARTVGPERNDEVVRPTPPSYPNTKHYERYTHAGGVVASVTAAKNDITVRSQPVPVTSPTPNRNTVVTSTTDSPPLIHNIVTRPLSPIAAPPLSANRVVATVTDTPRGHPSPLVAPVSDTSRGNNLQYPSPHSTVHNIVTRPLSQIAAPPLSANRVVATVTDTPRGHPSPVVATVSDTSRENNPQYPSSHSTVHNIVERPTVHNIVARPIVHNIVARPSSPIAAPPLSANRVVATVTDTSRGQPSPVVATVSDTTSRGNNLQYPSSHSTVHNIVARPSSPIAAPPHSTTTPPAIMSASLPGDGHTNMRNPPSPPHHPPRNAISPINFNRVTDNTRNKSDANVTGPPPLPVPPSQVRPVGRTMVVVRDSQRNELPTVTNQPPIPVSNLPAPPPSPRTIDISGSAIANNGISNDVKEICVKLSDLSNEELEQIDKDVSKCSLSMNISCLGDAIERIKSVAPQGANGSALHYVIVQFKKSEDNNKSLTKSEKSIRKSLKIHLGKDNNLCRLARFKFRDLVKDGISSPLDFYDYTPYVGEYAPQYNPFTHAKDPGIRCEWKMCYCSTTVGSMKCKNLKYAYILVPKA